MRKIINVAHHRSGVSGEPFYVVRFKDKRQNMIGIVFEANRTVAVFDSDLLRQDVIAFAANSWRGDEYEAFLRGAVAKFEEMLAAAPDGKAIARVMNGGPAIWRETRKPSKAGERQQSQPQVT